MWRFPVVACSASACERHTNDIEAAEAREAQELGNTSAFVRDARVAISGDSASLDTPQDVVGAEHLPLAPERPFWCTVLRQKPKL